MKRGLIFGALAFGAAYLAERQFVVVMKDMDRYNRLRAMSDEPPLLNAVGTQLGSLLSSFGSQRQGKAKSLIASLTGDVIRYARIRAM